MQPFSDFAYRKDHERFVKRMLKTRELDQQYLLELAAHHPKCKGAVSFDMHSNGLLAVWDDGYTATFSYHVALDRWMANKTGRSVRDSHRGEVYRAFRNEVQDQTRAVRARAGLQGRGAEFHVGHDWESGDSFRNILNAFLQSQGVSVDAVKLVYQKQRASHLYESAYLENRELATAWHEWHKERATGMRMETAEQNIRAPE